MAEVTAAMIKELRARTSAGFMDCKKALVEHDGDMKKAIEYLKVKGMASAAKRSGRSAKEGVIGSYIHHDKRTGVLVELNCETDFVARTEDFQNFAKQLAIHICANSPIALRSEDIDEKVVAAQKEIFVKQAAESGKPEAVIEKMIAGKMQKWLKEVSLLDQPYIDDADKTVEEARAELAAKTGENVQIGRFSRISISDVIDKD